MAQKLQHTDYDIAWICALPLELAAAKSMLDEIHPSLPQAPSDQNSYTLGRISGHNIVLVCLPSGTYGTTSAATVLSQMLSTFSSISYGLMVGIGGGIPSRDRDIRLGDVVVSTPSGISGGVIQYDHGKALPDKSFETTGSFNRPPPVLLSAVSQMRSNHMVNCLELQATIAKALQSHKYIKEHFSRPGRDWLFNAAHKHCTDAIDCSACDKTQLVDRLPRRSHEPRIHYGLIASGNQVIKDAQTRDLISHRLGGRILCLEMEAAGLMNQLPCLVIRGICDYCDSHKQDDWHGYGALSAAAYAKVLLTLVPVGARFDRPWVGSEEQAKHYEFNNSGSGSQFNVNGGSQSNNTGNGNQFFGGFHGPVSFG
ncbi:hypothetical protein ASPVEDRAFT_89572 [Aspergillus versicolor CBS 583.65]|uniref:Nucleoside phosphorylase domain-containing protein n=1 Tax=Aspergillus versicolor CBS 583.65 TaxID=1036611 RepID=A0A1L9Q3J1_ASPVE|nr:uncharacterized protein ASPVEDRAFT_89572 [Aspergillus versicolor CBS 583.65]OJJ08345.1 hypothetical protein ASPVEDRAFT_89572 [Aspergillus versicolor CBS 583.65]